MNYKAISIVFSMLLVFTTASSAAVTKNTSTMNVMSTLDEPDWWPMYGHDLQHTGFSSSPAPETNTLLFSTQPVNPGSYSYISSGPTVVNGKLYSSYFGSPSCGIFCTDALTGALLWNRLFLELYFSPTVVDGRVYISGFAADNNYYLYCLNAENGSTLWGFPIDDAVVTSPTVSEGKIYFGTLSYSLYCLDINGTQVWSTFADFPFSSQEASPAVFDGKVYVTASLITSGPTYIYCYNAADGALLWTYYTPKGPGKSPTVVNSNICVGAGNTIFCLDAVGNGDGTTSVLWSYTITGSVTSTATAYDNVYFGSSTGKTYCINASTGAFLWNYTTVGYCTTPAVADEKVYLVATSGDYGTYDNRMYCLDALGNGNGTTSVIWQYVPADHNVFARAQPAIGKSIVWVATDNNWVYAFSDNHAPVRPGIPSGPSQGFTGVEYSFCSSTTDPDGNNISYRWDWGDGIFSDWSEYISSGVLITASHSWPGPGSYFVKIQARDEIGFMTPWSVGHLITIQPYQTMTVDAHGPYTGVIGEMIPFIGNVTGGAPEYSWHWDFGNGETSDVQNPLYGYAKVGTYTVTLNVTDATHNTVSDTTLVTISTAAAPKLIISSITGGFGVSAIIKNNGTANATNVRWSIRLNGGIIILGNETTGMIDTLAPGAEETIKSGLILGFGRTTIIVTAICNEASGSSAENIASGFVFLFFVLGVK
jgi:outer membrane protein assembly factor BamB